MATKPNGRFYAPRPLRGWGAATNFVKTHWCGIALSAAVGLVGVALGHIE